jgi:DNA modification methylase
MENNIIIRGDCLDVLKTVPDESVHLVVTDPPYGDNFAYGRNNRTIKGNASPLIGLIALQECYRTLKRNSNAYMFLDIKHLPIVRLFFEQYTSFAIRDFVVWDKVNMGMGRGFRKRHELIAVLEKGKPVYNNLGVANVLNIKRVNTEEHPHKKPAELIEKLILQSSQPGDTVLDPFVGAGTTCLAAKKLGRKFVGIELDDQYCDLAAARINESHSCRRKRKAGREREWSS